MEIVVGVSHCYAPLGIRASGAARSLRERIRAHTKTIGPQVWFLSYQADVRLRPEELERLLRRARLADAAPRAAGGTGLAGFDTLRP